MDSENNDVIKDPKAYAENERAKQTSSPVLTHTVKF